MYPIFLLLCTHCRVRQKSVLFPVHHNPVSANSSNSYTSARYRDFFSFYMWAFDPPLKLDFIPVASYQEALFILLFIFAPRGHLFQSRWIAPRTRGMPSRDSVLKRDRNRAAPQVLTSRAVILRASLGYVDGHIIVC